MALNLVLIRHGESVWNKENRFTGWTDVDLSPSGLEEARKAGQLMKSEGLQFQGAYTSVLKRAIRTLNTALAEMDLDWIPVTKDWHLNERHYGSLQGLNKSEMAAKFGEDQVFQWRRSFNVRPPALESSDSRHPSQDKRYGTVPREQLPSTESLQDCIARVVPYWQRALWPRVAAGERLLIAAHGNSIRALLKHLKGLSESEIMEVNIPTATPLLLELSVDGRCLADRYLGDPEAVKAAQASVAAQGKKQ